MLMPIWQTPTQMPAFTKAKTGAVGFLSIIVIGRVSRNIKISYLIPTPPPLGAALMDSQQVQLFHEHVLVKEAATSVPTPWHQDAPYYCVDSAKTVSMWIPLDDVPRDTTLEFISGSHKWDKFYRPQRFDGSALNENDGLEAIPDINGHRNDYEILGWAVRPGDAIAFDYRTIHGAPANTSKSNQRRAFSLTVGWG